MTSIFSNNTVELKHKRVIYTAPKHIFLKVDSNNTLNNKDDYTGTFGLYTVNTENFLDGAYSIVLKYEDKAAKNKEHSRIALKISCYTKTYFNKVKQELDIYDMLRKKKDYSKYICACYGIETLKYGRKTFNYLTMEYLTCDLFDFIFKHKRSYSDKNVYSILLQTIHGLQFLHKNNIIYNDLKMENIMISSMKCNPETGENIIKTKLIDFNCSTILNHNREGGSKHIEIGGGTLEYMSPELQRCVNRKSFYSLTPKSDVWSIGILACMLFLHSQPYEDKTSRLIIKNVQMNIYNDINKCIEYVNNIKDVSSIPSFIKNSKEIENTLITIMDMCFKTKLNKRSTMEDLNDLLS